MTGRVCRLLLAVGHILLGVVAVNLVLKLVSLGLNLPLEPVCCGQILEGDTEIVKADNTEAAGRLPRHDHLHGDHLQPSRYLLELQGLRFHGFEFLLRFLGTDDGFISG